LLKNLREYLPIYNSACLLCLTVQRTQLKKMMAANIYLLTRLIPMVKHIVFIERCLPYRAIFGIRSLTLASGINALIGFETTSISQIVDCCFILALHCFTDSPVHGKGKLNTLSTASAILEKLTFPASSSLSLHFRVKTVSSPPEWYGNL
jgi:hypothetical protein